MLLVQKRTVSLKRFFCAPKTYVKNDDSKYLQLYAKMLSLSKPVWNVNSTMQLDIIEVVEVFYHKIFS